MNLLKLKTLFVTLLLLFAFKAHSQEVNADRITPKLTKNAIYGTLGVFPSLSPLYASYSINAERELWNFGGFVKSIRARLGGGEWVSDSIGGEPKEGIHFTGTINVLTGARTFHMEVNFGTIYLNDKLEQENHLLPAFRFGFRLQKPEGNFLFRLGAGFPEGMYLSFGAAF